MKKLFVILLVSFAHSVFAQTISDEMKFVKIDSTVRISTLKLMELTMLYASPDSIQINAKNVTMFFFAANVKTTVSKKFCELYLAVSEKLIDLRIKIRLAEIRSREFNSQYQELQGPGATSGGSGGQETFKFQPQSTTGKSAVKIKL